MSTSIDAAAYGVEPAAKVWRVSRARHAPMQIPPIEMQGTGRFDDNRDSMTTGEDRFGVLYCSETPLASFLEVLAPLREHIASRHGVVNSIIMDVEEREQSNRLIGQARNVVSTRWQQEWQLTSANLIVPEPVFDLVSPAAVQFAREQLALFLLVLELDDLDFSNILSSDRNLTSGISRWIWSIQNENGEPLFSGIRYRSRFDPECICLALYQDRFSVDGKVRTQSITPDTPGFDEAASILRLKIA